MGKVTRQKAQTVTNNYMQEWIAMKDVTSISVRGSKDEDVYILIITKENPEKTKQKIGEEIDGVRIVFRKGKFKAYHKEDVEDIVDRYKEEWFKNDEVRMICAIPRGKDEYIILIATDGEPTEEIKRKIGEEIDGVTIQFEKTTSPT